MTSENQNMLKKLKQNLYQELEAEKSLTQLGQGWISGVLALALSLACFLGVVSLRYPELFTVPEIRAHVNVTVIRLGVQIVLMIAFVLACISLMLRQHKWMGILAAVVVILSVVLGGSGTTTSIESSGSVYFALDWFVLKLFLTGIIFLPLERLFRRVPQSVFRFEWREDLLYFFISSVMIQSFTLLSLAPSMVLLDVLEINDVQASIASQPVWLQFIEIMLVTDFMQYWFHRLFHQIPFLWTFHAVHHSAQAMDWIAGSRMHVVEIVMLRGITVIPMYILGFTEPALYAYLILVYLYATYLHANLKWDVEWVKPVLATPRFHHWHHAIEKEAIDTNFSIHFPFLDRLFGTYYVPEGKWPTGYGILVLLTDFRTT